MLSACEEHQSLWSSEAEEVREEAVELRYYKWDMWVRMLDASGFCGECRLKRGE